MTDALLKARKEMRKLQNEFTFSPLMCVYISNRWDAALEVDPSGNSLKYLIEDIREIMTPMKN